MDIPVFAYILLKLASRCNINCSYCYWFRDDSVYDKPRVLELEAEVAFCDKLAEHVTTYDLPEFTILLHGGEPMLFGKQRFEGFMDRLDTVSERTGCNLVRLISTNAMLVDDEWASLFKRYDVRVSVSIDGPPEVHDTHRLDFKGKGTHERTLKGLETLRRGGLKPGVIAVCQPTRDPGPTVEHIVENLGIRKFDILPPDATHEDSVEPIAPYYTKLFDLWYDGYGPQGVEIRILSGILNGMFGTKSVTDSIGYGPIHTVTLLTDGTLEPLDVLRIAGTRTTHTELNIRTHTLQDVESSPVWMRAFDASLNLCDTCDRCEYVDVCGGGHLAHRFAAETGYDNPSVYCEDWKTIFEHVYARVAPDLRVVRDGEEVRLTELAATASEAFSQGIGVSARY